VLRWLLDGGYAREAYFSRLAGGVGWVHENPVTAADRRMLRCWMAAMRAKHIPRVAGGLASVREKPVTAAGRRMLRCWMAVMRAKHIPRVAGGLASVHEKRRILSQGRGRGAGVPMTAAGRSLPPGTDSPMPRARRLRQVSIHCRRCAKSRRLPSTRRSGAPVRSGWPTATRAGGRPLASGCVRRASCAGRTRSSALALVTGISARGEKRCIAPFAEPQPQ
jgi:hypothetical protein